MPTWVLTIEGDPIAIQPGWSLEQTANGRDTLQFAVLSEDGSYRPALDDEVLFEERVIIATSSVANPTVITTLEPHGVVTGLCVKIASHVGSTPALDGWHWATVTGPTTLTVPVNVTVGGTGGWLSRRIFGGTVVTPLEAGQGGYGLQPIVTSVSADDFNAIAARRFVNEILLAGTLKSQLTTLVTNYVTTDSVSLHPDQVDGPAMPDLPCEYVSVESVLETLSLQTGYVWEIDEFRNLSMYLPVGVAAPVNVVTGNGVAIGDVVVEPSRGQYANRVILRFSAEAQRAYAFLWVAAGQNFADTETVKIGSTTYTFQTVLTDVAGNVLIGGDNEQSLDNLIAAIMLGGGSGTVYAASTIVNASAEAGFQSHTADWMAIKASALTAGAAGNSISVETTAVHASWVGEGLSPVITFAQGADRSLTNVSVANDGGEQAAHGIWEVVIESPDTVSQALADVLSAAYLAVRTPVPKVVTYETYALGLRPGQTQTIDLTWRNVNNTFLITDVSAHNNIGNYVIRTVTAIESALLQSAARWQDTYKQWSGTVGGGGTSVGGAGGTIVQVTGAIYGFGGSQGEWVQTTAGAWVAANSIQIAIDSSVRGSTIATCCVRMRADAGCVVTARLRNVSDSITVGTSPPVNSTSFVTVEFAVVLTAGSKRYEIELSPSVTDAMMNLGSAYLE